MGLPWWLSGKESTSKCGRHRRLRFNPWVGKIPWRRERLPTAVVVPGEFHEMRSLMATVHGVEKELDTAD